VYLYQNSSKFFIFPGEEILKYIVTNILGINNKLNKIIINQSEQEKMLEAILCSKSDLNESLDIIVIDSLDDFPIADKKSLKVVDEKLNNDNIFLKNWYFIVILFFP